MRTLIIALVFSLLLSGPIFAAVDGATISEDSTATTTYVSGSHLAILNQGTNEIYVEVAQGGTVATATTSSLRLDANEGIVMDSEDQRDFTAISTVCDTAETATITYAYWD